MLTNDIQEELPKLMDADSQLQQRQQKEKQEVSEHLMTKNKFKIKCVVSRRCPVHQAALQ